ncbi:type I glyceraldehyde-3-phosphate dehydrogenase [Brevirhabdus sp.]|uniref:type I glyceraldehyde-3-phosphate dehydrogenase n=1 Tax=Brevirhabdus sp. TaxID=2004514 RepID=UPI0040591BFB
MTVKVAINGFGRIGRSVLRAWLTRNLWPEVEIVLLNDIAPLDACRYLLQYDSVFGPYPGRVAAAPEALQVDDRRFAFHRESNLAALDLSGIDVVMDCTGKAGQRPVAEALLQAGAGRVLISGPAPQADLTLVKGVNDAALRARHKIVSNASCTTNALAPLLRLLDTLAGIETGYMTTIHCYTGSQPSVDLPTGDLARSRAAALSIVPTSTSASRLTDLVLPDLAGRIEGSAVRVPSASVSAVDLTYMPKTRVDVPRLNAAFRDAGGVIGCTDDPVVSTDMRMRGESIIMQTGETAVTAGGMARVFGWYDNEWGFSNRMLDVARLMGARAD